MAAEQEEAADKEINEENMHLILSHSFRSQGCLINNDVLDLIMKYYPFIAFYLYRFISGYSGVNQLLGIFTTIQNASQAKKEYIIKMEKEGDKYAEQGYHEVDLEKDVRIRKCDGFTIITKEDYIYAICYLGYGFGQSSRSVKGWSSKEAIDEIFPNKISDQSGMGMGMIMFGGMGGYHVDPLPINKLRIGNVTDQKLNIKGEQLKAAFDDLVKLQRFDIAIYSF